MSQTPRKNVEKFDSVSIVLFECGCSDASLWDSKSYVNNVLHLILDHTDDIKKIFRASQFYIFLTFIFVSQT